MKVSLARSCAVSLVRANDCILANLSRSNWVLMSMLPTRQTRDTGAFYNFSFLCGPEDVRALPEPLLR